MWLFCAELSHRQPKSLPCQRRASKHLSKEKSDYKVMYEQQKQVEEVQKEKFQEKSTELEKTIEMLQEKGKFNLKIQI